jgi:hypothetical protein
MFRIVVEEFEFNDDLPLPTQKVVCITIHASYQFTVKQQTKPKLKNKNKNKNVEDEDEEEE